MKQKFKFQSSSVVNAEDSKDIETIARAKGIKVPSSHLGFFKTVYARIESPNKNGIRLSRDAVQKALPGLIGGQCNFEHLRQGFICGNILDAWINAENEIVVVYSFFKSVYPEEYEQSLELLEKGKLSVSFELLADRDTQDSLEDGTFRLNDIDFQGMGHLMMNDPAEPTAKVFEFAKKVRERLSNQKEDRELVCASQIEKTCDALLAQEDIMMEDEIIFTTITSRDDMHIHVVKVDENGNGVSSGPYGDDEAPHQHRIVNFQVQEASGHAHRVIEELLANKKETVVKDTKDNEANLKNNKGGKNEMDEEQKKLVAQVREELGEIAKDVSDEELLDEAKVAELRKEKEEAKSDEDSELDKAKAEIEELKQKVETLEAEITAKDSEIEEVRENAEKIAKLKIELKDNPYVADFTDENYLDESKVSEAVNKKQIDDLKAENEALKKSSKSTKKEEDVKASVDSEEDEDDFSDVMNAKVKNFRK